MVPLSLPSYEDVVKEQCAMPLMAQVRGRAALIEREGFTRLNRELVATLGQLFKGKRILEIGAGLGYLSAALASQGLEVTAWDAQRGYKRLGWHPDKCYYPIEKVDALLRPSFDADVVILAWPCYNTPFAYEVSRRMVKGQTLVYLGEGKGGCTADDAFHYALKSIRWAKEEHASDLLNAYHVSDGAIYDSWSVYRCQLGNEPLTLTVA